MLGSIQFGKKDWTGNIEDSYRSFDYNGQNTCECFIMRARQYCVSPLYSISSYRRRSVGVSRVGLSALPVVPSPLKIVKPPSTAADVSQFRSSLIWFYHFEQHLYYQKQWSYHNIIGGLLQWARSYCPYYKLTYIYIHQCLSKSRPWVKLTERGGRVKLGVGAGSCRGKIERMVTGRRIFFVQVVLKS